MIDQLEVPETLQRNHPSVATAGYEHTGQVLMNLAAQAAGFHNLENVDILDVGCGVRFTMTIINRKIPIKSYTGVEVSLPIVEFLRDKVESRDKRFKFAHWNVHNPMYNAEGGNLTTQSGLPINGSFDLIWLFSVFTHQNPSDSFSLLRILRKHIRSDGRLFFSAFIDDELDGFEDRVKDKPLLHAFYGMKNMQSLVEQSGWKIEADYDADPENYIAHSFVCSPNYRTF